MTEPDPQPIVVATGLDMALDILLDGITTGISTALASFMQHESEERRDAITDDMVAGMIADPAVMEMLRDNVRERLLGVDTSPKNLRFRGFR